MQIPENVTIYNAFNVHPDVVDLMDALHKKQIPLVRSIMEDIIHAYTMANPLNVVLNSWDAVINHNEVVKKLDEMEQVYSDYVTKYFAEYIPA